MASFKKCFIRSAQDVYDKFFHVKSDSDWKKRRPGAYKILIVTVALAVYTTIFPDSILVKPIASIICIVFFIICGMALVRYVNDGGNTEVSRYIPGQERAQGKEEVLKSSEPPFWEHSAGAYYEEEEEEQEEQEEQEEDPVPVKKEDPKYNPVIGEVIFGVPFDPRS